ncbi:MAG: bifunctional methylenetetrahydrofolate dehydrogenase/methenyltetrahydrofolate cyclohydrolase FolD [Clostridia bacterium]|nr:bifunctional methylenetetrahydrofolate dehydrogenase/methenyltetrahydrofolate cyclohydrolase FolD [Clostridia bacterium]
MTTIINGKELSKKIRGQVKEEVENLNKKGIHPKLAVIMVGEDPASKVYVRNKSKACNEAGIEYEEFILNENIEMDELLSVIETLNNRKDIHGILLQSPIPKHLDIYKAFETIDSKKDVDGFNPINIGKLELNRETFISCTPHGVIKMLEEYNINLKGANVVVLGRSNIVGKPLVQCLLNKDATVTICHSKTKNIEEITRNADILISAIGKPKFVTANMVKENAVVIDVGINRLETGLVGDVDFEEVSKKASYITPVPGGVGPMTIAMLLQNVVTAAKGLEEK